MKSMALFPPSVHGVAVASSPFSPALPPKSMAARCCFPLSVRPGPKPPSVKWKIFPVAAAAAAADGDMTAGFQRRMMRDVGGGLTIPDPDDHQTTTVIVQSPMGTTTNTNLLMKYPRSFPICGAGEFPATLAAGSRGKRCWGVRCLRNDDNAAAAEEPDGEKAATGFTTVMKFEGSSLASAKRMAKVADLVLSLTKDKERPVVLLSAMGNTASNLIQAGEKALSFAFSSVSEIQDVWDIMDLHLRTIDELGLDSSIISGLFEELEQLLKRIATMEVLTQTAGDELVSIGECMSTTIFSAYLNKLGKIKARQYGAFDIGLITPIDLSDANVLELTCAAVVKRLLEDWSVEPAIPIVAGFLGKGCKSYARGHNDLIAATIAKALGLSEIQVWKDVDGLLTRDLNKYFTSELEADLQIIKNDDLEELRELDSGAYGTVYHAKWKGTDVAVKFLKKNCFKKLEHAGFWQEITILSKLRHPNVLPFYGVVLNGQGGTTLGTVTEFMVDGSLRHVLQHKAKYLDDHKRLIIATDAALGVEYMHSKDIVHFDLKSGNLLVNLQNETRPICKVGDFGLSKIRKGASVSGFRRGTVRWMAPELMIVSKPSNKVSTKVDVYSFGIVMWEILTGELPYNSLFDNDLISWGVVNNKLRPLVPESCDPEWRTLMEQCWAHDPAQRPDFSEIVLRLRAMSTAANYS